MFSAQDLSTFSTFQSTNKGLNSTGISTLTGTLSVKLEGCDHYICSSLDFAENVQRYRSFIFHNTIYRGQKHLSNHSYA